MTIERCAWARSGALDAEYHDREWGVPVTDDVVLFEFLTLEGAQAGLSWTTILKKRAGYRRAFKGFDPRRVARLRPSTVDKLLQDPSIVRNRAKVESTVSNAKATLEIQKEFGTLSAFLWSFVGGRPINNSFETLRDLPTETPESRAMSRALKKRGFRFVGPTICYAFMQACGMVNDHEVSCFRHQPVKKMARGLQIGR